MWLDMRPDMWPDMWLDMWRLGANHLYIPDTSQTELGKLNLHDSYMQLKEYISKKLNFKYIIY